MPRVYLIPSEQPNAFATGRNPKNAVVAVTEGLLRYLPREQVKGVLAHEMGHVANRDILVMTIAAMIGAAIAAIANILQFSMFFGGGDDDDNPLGIVGVLAAVIVAPLAAMILQLAVSRQREYLADATAAQYLGEGRPLAEALGTLERGVEAVPMNVNPATESLYIANPLSAAGHVGALLDAPADGRADQASAGARRARTASTTRLDAPMAALAAAQAGSRARAAGAASRAAGRGGGARPVRAAATAARQRRRRARASRGAEGHRRSRTGALLGGDRSGVANAEWWRSRRRSSTASIDLALSWSEQELPERERTKHVHRLHPVSRQVRAAARRGDARALRAPRRAGARPVRRLGDDARAGARVRLRRRRGRHRGVQRAPRLGQDARTRPRVARRGCARGAGSGWPRRPSAPTGFAAEWFAPQAAAELLHFRSLIAEYASQDVLRVVLARAARSARLTTHFDLDFPRAPQQGEYWCHKHRRTCRPVESAASSSLAT